MLLSFFRDATKINFDLSRTVFYGCELLTGDQWESATPSPQFSKRAMKPLAPNREFAEAWPHFSTLVLSGLSGMLPLVRQRIVVPKTLGLL